MSSLFNHITTKFFNTPSKILIQCIAVQWLAMKTSILLNIICYEYNILNIRHKYNIPKIFTEINRFNVRGCHFHAYILYFCIDLLFSCLFYLQLLNISFWIILFGQIFFCSFIISISKNFLSTLFIKTPLSLFPFWTNFNFLNPVCVWCFMKGFCNLKKNLIPLFPKEICILFLFPVIFNRYFIFSNHFFFMIHIIFVLIFLCYFSTKSNLFYL